MVRHSIEHRKGLIQQFLSWGGWKRKEADTLRTEQFNMTVKNAAILTIIIFNIKSTMLFCVFNCKMYQAIAIFFELMNF